MLGSAMAGSQQGLSAPSISHSLYTHGHHRRVSGRQRAVYIAQSPSQEDFVHKLSLFFECVVSSCGVFFFGSCSPAERGGGGERAAKDPANIQVDNIHMNRDKILP